MSLVRWEVVAYCDQGSDDDVDRVIDFMREQVGPHFIIVGKTEVDEDALAETLAENEHDVVPD